MGPRTIPTATAARTLISRSSTKTKSSGSTPKRPRCQQIDLGVGLCHRDITGQDHVVDQDPVAEIPQPLSTGAAGIVADDPVTIPRPSPRARPALKPSRSDPGPNSTPPTSNRRSPHAITLSRDGDHGDISSDSCHASHHRSGERSPRQLSRTQDHPGGCHGAGTARSFSSRRRNSSPHPHTVVLSRPTVPARPNAVPNRPDAAVARERRHTTERRPVPGSLTLRNRGW